MFFSVIGNFLGISNPFGTGSEIGSLMSMYNSIEKSINAMKSLSNFNKINYLSSGVDEGDIANKMIPTVYGTCIVDGKIMWASNIMEQTSSATTGQIISAVFSSKIQKTNARYFVDVAYLISKGEIDELIAVSINSGEYTSLQGFNYTLYSGTGTQMPNSTMYPNATDDAKAYRDMCYIVFKGLEITNYNANIPVMKFKVKRINKIRPFAKPVQALIEGVNLIPGGGEFVLDTTIQTKINGYMSGSNFVESGVRKTVNNNTLDSTKTDFVVAIDNLKNDIPSVKWVSTVVSWFGDSIDANVCMIYPAVEYASTGKTTPDDWNVAGITRLNANLVSRNASGGTNYGGTISDCAVVRGVEHLRSLGYKVCFNPVMMMDVSGKPWRGFITTSADKIQNFFRKTNGYNAYILHYANLLKGKVDAFMIGSEMKGLTGVKDANNNFVAVSELKNLASLVRNILGSGVKITYGANFDEYHHTDGGWYNLDPLWADVNIDVIGISAYFPLTDINYKPSIDEIMDGFESGEGYDCYYNWERTAKYPLDAAYAWKNLRWFVENDHYNPNGVKTAWTPKLKPYWFTEYGFASVDLSTNQPNVFYDPTSSLSSLPRGSMGYVDFASQQDAIQAVEMYRRKNSDIITNAFLWCWDARPYPYFPSLSNVWADYDSWKLGHWVSGKLNSSNLSNILDDICLKAGLKREEFDTSLINETVDGFTIKSDITFENLLKMLSIAYLFDVVVQNGVLKFLPLSSLSKVEIDFNDIVVDANTLQITSEINDISGWDRVNSVEVIFLDVDNGYSQSKTIAKLDYYDKENRKSINLPVAMSLAKANSIASVCLQAFNSSFVESVIYLPRTLKYLQIDVMNILSFTDFKGTAYSGIVKKIELTDHNDTEVVKITIQGVDGSFFNLAKLYNKSYAEAKEVFGGKSLGFNILSNVIASRVYYPNAVNNSSSLFCYLSGYSLNNKWTGCDLYYSADSFTSYSKLVSIFNRGIFGSVVSLSLYTNVNPLLIDAVSKIIIQISENRAGGQNLLPPDSATIILNGEIIKYNKIVKVGVGANGVSQYQISSLQRQIGGSQQISGGDISKFMFVNFGDLGDVASLVNLSPQMFGLLSFDSNPSTQISLQIKAVSFGDGVLTTQATVLNV